MDYELICDMCMVNNMFCSVRNFPMLCLGCAVFHIESVAFPEWITNPDMCERGERTFFDGEWYFNQDRDGNDVGPYRYLMVYGVRCVGKKDYLTIFYIYICVLFHT